MFQLLSPPAHTMAPMRTLCASVLRSLAVTAHRPQETVAEESDDDDDEPLFGEKAEDESDDEAPPRRRLNKPEAAEGDDNEKPKMDDLRDVFTESTSWTSILV